MSDSNEGGCPVFHTPKLGDGGDEQQLLSYGSYLKVPELLELQQLESDPPAHDELLFIIIHQAYELWFKLILSELDSARDAMRADDPYEAARLLSRVLKIEDLLVQQIHILETMTPRDFLSFRAALMPASGFQSAQFREVEFVSGMKAGGEVMKNMQMLEEERERLERRLEEPSLRTEFYELLERMGYDVAVPTEGEEPDEELNEQILDGLHPIYESPEKHHHIYNLAEALVSHDQNILLWRFHHVRVVERLIGTKPGTGGSAGVDYLSSTLSKRAFPLLWEVRGHLSDEALYGTRRGPTEPPAE
ncbi:MAG: tryptophan 2,3-dioxygenase [Persicimonas sp.]